MHQYQTLPQLNLPPAQLRFRQDAGKKADVFDIFRKKYVCLTPEEWVRQHIAHFLVNARAVPAGRLATEHSLLVNGMNRRADIAVFGHEGQPILLAECKAPEVAVNNSTFAQAAAYNTTLKVPYLLISNGLRHYCCKVDWTAGSWEVISGLPFYPDMF